ncbi:serine hydrolase domain-containing protein [Microbulbifer sp. ARAS458-1]|uniref:serine hydrolase domain-containing protein n=1 Tax=Microbulbifer sp. ARAS458-1 TaxID=3140242 RepID=UPI003877E7ED
MIFILFCAVAIIAATALLFGLQNPETKISQLLRLPGDAIYTLLHMSAKLACSAHHISGFTPQRIHRDLRNYSPLFALVSIDQSRDITCAKIGNLISVKACFHPLQGCRLIHQQSPAQLIEPPSHRDHYPKQSENECGYQWKASNPALQELLDSQLHHDHESGLDTRALLVIQGGQLQAEAYGLGISAHTPLLGWSMSKSLLAILFGRLETLGLADSTSLSLFPEWQNDRRSEITLQHLLQMCDGLAFDETYRPGSDATRMLFGTLPASRYALERPLLHTPGRHFSYSSGSTNLLARWIHRALGGTEATLHFWKKEFVEPLGLTSAILELDNDGVFIASSYGYATARDWAKIGGTLLKGLENAYGSQPFLDPMWLSHALSPNRSDNDPRYGFQLWLNNRTNRLPPLYPQLPEDSAFMLGNREQKLMIAPSHNAVVVRLGWSASPYPIEDRFGEILEVLPN